MFTFFFKFLFLMVNVRVFNITLIKNGVLMAQ